MEDIQQIRWFVLHIHTRQICWNITGCGVHWCWFWRGLRARSIELSAQKHERDSIIGERDFRLRAKRAKERRHSCRCLKHNAKRKLIQHGQQRDWALRAMFWTATGMSPLPVASDFATALRLHPPLPTCAPITIRTGSLGGDSPRELPAMTRASRTSPGVKPRRVT